VVAVGETSDGKLVIDPKYNIAPEPRTVTLRIGPHLSREIIGNYLLGFDIIRVEAKERISFESRDIVKKTASNLMGLEIVEEDYSSIVLQCMLEPSSFPPEKNLRRGYTIVAGMHRDVVASLVESDAQLAKSVVARDEESNRLYFVLVRILRTIIQTPGLSEKLEVSPIECLDYRLAASLVEAIGDECVRAASKVMELKGAEMAKDLKELFVNLHESCFVAHENALKAFLEGNMDLAENVRDGRAQIDKTFAKIEAVSREQSVDVMPQVLAVASFMRQIYEHSVDIADLVVPKIK
jgi:phosphate uptake regulator